MIREYTDSNTILAGGGQARLCRVQLDVGELLEVDGSDVFRT